MNHCSNYISTYLWAPDLFGTFGFGKQGGIFQNECLMYLLKARIRVSYIYILVILFMKTSF